MNPETNDEKLLRALGGATFGPSASLTLPSGKKLSSDEANWEADVREASPTTFTWDQLKSMGNVPQPWLEITPDGASRLADHIRLGLDTAAMAATDAERYAHLRNFVLTVVKDLGGAPELCDKQLDVATTTSVSWTAALVGGNACRVEFIAPPSGEVDVRSTVEMTAWATDAARTAIRVVDDQGTVICAPETGPTGSPNSQGGAKVGYVLDGLVPGRRYVAQQMFRVVAGTARIGRRELTVLTQATGGQRNG